MTPMAAAAAGENLNVLTIFLLLPITVEADHFLNGRPMF
jgi:hypothetical protein